MKDGHVSIVGLSKAAVLAALYNASQPLGMGLLQAMRPGVPKQMTEEQAEAELIGGDDHVRMFPDSNIHIGRMYFDYLHGRPLKTDLTDDVSFDPRGFDRDNGGEGAAQRVIDALRKREEAGTTA